MKKTLKTKVLAGTITVALLSSAGVAFAATDAGGAFKAWYVKEFASSSADVGAETLAYGNVKLQEGQTYVNGKKTETTNSITDKKDSEITRANTSINIAKQGHINKVNAAKTQIMNSMENQFNGLYYLGVQGINAASNLAYGAAKKDLEGHASTQGSAAVGEVNQKLSDAQNDAVNELKTAIDNAKADVKAALEAQEDVTVGKLQAYIDGKYNEVKEKVDTLVAELIATQQGLILAEANAREAAAKSALQEVVDGIN